MIYKIYKNTFLDPKLSGKWESDPDPRIKKIVSDPQHWQCCESGTGSRSTRIQNFL
jgi:hypothetical protein